MIALPPEPLRAALLAWFDRAGRDLPWRRGPEGGRDPYRAWVAEILLQQTQVARGLGYYERFLAAFPTVQALAAAPLEDVLKAWEGCGYYARARNLHRAAAQVAAQGAFPGSYEGWLALPGVGPYTAAALSSFTLGAPHAVNDGNVRRVLARLYGERAPSPAWVQARADALLDPARPGAWNEAVMDLGATVCTPKAPRCAPCPLAQWCAARASGEPTAYPAPKVRAPVQAVQAVAALIGSRERAHLERREGTLLGGLMGLPAEALLAGESPEAALARLCARLGATPGPLLGQVRHGMTHRQVTLHVYRAQAELPLQPVAQAALARLDQKALALEAARQEGLFPA
ncbi:A/G-specific adenine glycosylase [Deinococcus multiflagellatus]|uniref:Adenine DNA glycosylase n=1 Tax=Deinococcus multiflagellatus TaxID=1656887 RepID=A0ABW1ZKD8_9DEIO|nr:A/G-specific adenine glycosylase [Deinococcus multiflagellatus]MBZ9712395.1 A/G-specific adenine glycosylase [Deinococcus multiflagellatus]